MRAWRNNVFAKLLSLVAAIGLWVYVMSEQNPMVQVSYTIPVRIEGISTNYVVDGVPSTVKVTISGPRNRILHLDPSMLEATLNLRGTEVGNHQVKINFTPPSGLTSVAMTPNVADVYVDEHAVSYVPITFKPSDKLPDTIALQDIKVHPEKVTISGASRWVRSVKSAVIIGKLDGRTGPVTIQGPILLYNGQGGLVKDVEALPTSGEVTFTVAVVKDTKSLAITPKVKGRPQRGYMVSNIEVVPKTIDVIGPPDVLNSLSTIETNPVEVDDLTGNAEKTVELRLPEGVTAPVGTVKVTVHVHKNGTT